MFLSNRGSFRPETSGAYTLRRRGRRRPKSGSAIGACAVARLAGSGGPIGDYYGSANTALADDLVVGLGCVDAPLVGVQHADVARSRLQPPHGLRPGSLDLLPRLLEAVVVDARPAASFREAAPYDLLREHVEVKSELPVPAPRPERRHVGDYHLARAIDRLPRGEDEVGVRIARLALAILLLMLGLGAYAQVEKASPDVFRGHRYAIAPLEVGVHPPVPVRGVGVVAALHQPQHLRAVFRRIPAPLPPLVEAGAAHAAQAAEPGYRELLRERLDDRALFSDTGTNSPGVPSSLGIRM